MGFSHHIISYHIISYHIVSCQICNRLNTSYHQNATHVRVKLCAQVVEISVFHRIGLTCNFLLERLNVQLAEKKVADKKMTTCFQLATFEGAQDAVRFWSSHVSRLHVVPDKLCWHFNDYYFVADQRAKYNHIFLWTAKSTINIICNSFAIPLDLGTLQLHAAVPFQGVEQRCSF